ncbi:MAG: LPXTG cell wall anchor domain-containing protein [Microbacterium sp.]
MNATTRRRIRAVLSATAVAVALVLAIAAPARAAGEIGLSADGVTWGSTLPQPLFDAAIRWVPGDVRTARFYVRNQTADGIRTDVDLVASRVEELITTGDLSIDVRIAGGEWVPTTVTGTQRLSSESIPAGGSYPVDVRVRFFKESANVSQSLPLDLQLRVTLTETVPDGGSNGGGSTPNLPVTGGSFDLSSAVVGVTAVGLGIVLAARRRRSREDAADER